MSAPVGLALGVLAALCVMVGATGCSSSGSQSSSPPQPSSLPQPVPSTSSTPSGVRGTEIYVGNDLGNNLTSFPAEGTGNIIPDTNISGANTLLQHPYVIALDSAAGGGGGGGIIWTPNYVTTLPDFVTAYGVGETGNEAPIADLSGSNTGFSSQYTVGAFVDNSENIYITTTNGLTGSISFFSKGSNGNVTPNVISGANTTLGQPLGISTNGAGSIIVSDFLKASIDTFASGASGNVAPSSTISGPNTTLSSPFGLALDSSGNIYVANPGTKAVLVFAAGSSGNSAPTRVISGANTLLQYPTGIAVDGVGYIYVADAIANAVLVFAPTANLNVAPVQNISGANTGLDSPRGLALLTCYFCYETHENAKHHTKTRLGLRP